MPAGRTVGAVTGKPIPDPGFAGDQGEADACLAAALATYTRDPVREPEVLAALAAARVFVPVVAVLAEETDVPAGDLRREKSTDMALATLIGTDGRRALPVFSSVATLAAWNAEARPVPVEAPRAALSAAAEGAQVLVVDVAGPTSYVVSGSALRRLAEGDACRPAYDDPRVADEVARLCAEHPAVRAAWLVPAEGLDARVVLQVEAGTASRQDLYADSAAAVSAAAHEFAAAVRDSDVLRAVLLRGLDLALLPPDAQPARASLYRRAVLD